MTLSKQALRALSIIAEKPPLTPHEFALEMWPEDDERYTHNWARSHNCGNYGSTTGAPMWMAAGSFLSKLAKRGLISYDRRRGGIGFDIYITGEGQKALREASR